MKNLENTQTRDGHRVRGVKSVMVGVVGQSVATPKLVGEYYHSGRFGWVNASWDQFGNWSSSLTDCALDLIFTANH